MSSNKWTKIFCAMTGLALLSAGAHGLTIDVTEVDSIQYLMMSGEFSDESVDGPRKVSANQDSVNLLNSFRTASRGRITAILVTSDGGSREAAVDVSQTVNFIAKLHYEKNKRPMVVALVGNCHSACTFFAAALTKSHNRKHLRIFSPADTQFRFHGPVNLEDGRALPRREFEHHLATGIAQYLESGVERQWLHKNQSMFRTSGGKVFDAKALCRQNTMVIPPDACIPTYDDVEKKILQLSNRSGRNPFRKIFEILTGAN